MDIVNSCSVTESKEPFVNFARRRHAFSLVELLVVIALITILGSLLLIGIGHLITNSKRQQTNLAFQNLQAMYAEFDAVNHQHFGNDSIPCPHNVAIGGTDRATAQVLLTRGIISQMKTMPANATALGKISAAAYTSVVFNVSSVAAYAANTSYLPLDVAYTKGSDVLGNEVDYYFVCIQTNTSASTTDLQYWIPVGSRTTNPVMPSTDTTDATVPILTDGWGNPIIYVPGRLGSDPGASPALRNASYLVAANQQIRVGSPDGRPFWASAGPDGDFSIGDDNMYSFEK